MPKELYIYSPIYDFVAEKVVSEMNAIGNDEDITIRLNTPGGYTTAGWSIVSKMAERTGKNNIIVDGQAASFGALMMAFGDHVTAKDTSELMFHKAGFPSWHEPSAEEQERLDNINNQFKGKLKAKLKDNDVSKLFMKKVFQKDVRNDVYVSPKEAKQMGIVDSVETLTPSAFNTKIQVVAMVESKQETQANNNTPSGENNNSKLEYMDLQTLKSSHPAVYQAAFEEGRIQGNTEGVAKEKERTTAWAVYMDVDPKKVKAGIDSGNNISSVDFAEFNLQIAKDQVLKAQKDDNPGDIDTDKDKKTTEQLKEEENKAAMDKVFGTEKKEGE